MTNSKSHARNLRTVSVLQKQVTTLSAENYSLKEENARLVKLLRECENQIFEYREIIRRG